MFEIFSVDSPISMIVLLSHVNLVITFNNNINVINIDNLYQVRMAERSKAPDSRATFLIHTERAFWSSYEGLGSNFTSDKLFSC